MEVMIALVINTVKEEKYAKYKIKKPYVLFIVVTVFLWVNKNSQMVVMMVIMLIVMDAQNV